MIVLREDILEFAKSSSIPYLDESGGKKPMSENRTLKITQIWYNLMKMQLKPPYSTFGGVRFSGIGFLPLVSSK